jgi:hypothetical protein
VLAARYVWAQTLLNHMISTASPTQREIWVWTLRPTSRQCTPAWFAARWDWKP